MLLVLVLAVACGASSAPTTAPMATAAPPPAEPTPPPTAIPTPEAEDAPAPKPTTPVASQTQAPEPTPAPEPTAAPQPQPTPDPFPLTLMDDVGRQVTIESRPSRVAATNAFVVELMMACGYTPAARPDIPVAEIQPPEAVDIPSISIDHAAGPNMEQIVQVRPDLIITAPTYGRFVPAMEGLGTPVLVHDISSFEGIVEKTRTYGQLVGCEVQAEENIEELETKLAALQEGLPGESPKVLAIFGNPDSFLSFMPTSYLGNMVGHLGGSMITEGDPPYMYRGQPNLKYTPFSLEKVVENDPDVIFFVSHDNPADPREVDFTGLFESPVWGGLRAVQEGRVHELTEWLYVRYPGPQVVDALERLKPLLYPAE